MSRDHSDLRSVRLGSDVRPNARDEQRMKDHGGPRMPRRKIDLSDKDPARGGPEMMMRMGSTRIAL